jgi:serine/threonine-protein kinase
MSDRERIGRYEIASTISQGGMGSVFLARDPQLNRQVAVKLLLETLESDEWRRRFQREAKALARLDHPHIVTIFDFGEDDRGRPYIVMEYVRGRHLGELVGTPLPLVQKLTLLEQLCTGLDCAHEAGIAHLDIKPANLIVDTAGRLRIVDFGIARGLDSRVTRPTVPDARSGTPSYMAPEQVLGETIGPRADQFAAGAVAYELLSGRRAFTGTLREVVAKICAADPPSLSQVSPGIDPGLEAVVVRALSKHPQNRFPSMAAMARSFAEARERLDTHSSATVTSVAVPPPASSGQTTIAAPLPTFATPAPTVASPLFGDVAQPRPRARSRGWLVVAAAAIVVVGLLVGILMNQGGGAETGSTSGEGASGKEGTPAPDRPEPTDTPVNPAKRADEPKAGDRVAVPDPRRQREIDQVARLFDAGGRDVLGAIESALERYPGDAEITGWLARVATRAQDSLGRRQQAAVAAGASAAPTFSEGVQAQRDALDLGRQGMTAAAIRRLWDAEEDFATALEWKADTPATGATTSRGRPAPETENAVRVPLSSLARAYATLSAAAVKVEFPGLTADEARALDRSFLDYSAYRLDIQIVKATFRGGRATVNCAIEATVTLRSGEERRSSSSATFGLESSNGSWVIASASRLPN